VEDVATPVVLTIGDEKVAIYPFPYLDPDDARRRLVADDEEPLERSHAAVLGRAMDLVRADLQQRPEYRSVVVAHAFVVGSSGRDAAEVSDSERDISVGTVDSAPADVFMGVDYVALGHLHGRQRPKAPSDGPVLHYSGSLLRYSLSEANHTKSATLVDITSDGAVALEYVDISQPRQMARISGRFADLIDPDGQHSAHREDWVQITVTDPSRPPDMVATLRGAFPHSLVLRHEPEGQVDGGVSAGTNVAAMTPREVVAEFVSDMGGVDMTDAEAAALEPVLTTVFGQGR
jgi:exonuclease SbcD